MPEMNPQEPPKTKSEALDKIREAIQGYARAAAAEDGDDDGLIVIDFIFAAVSVDASSSDRESIYTWDGSGMAHTNIGLGELFLRWARDDGFEDEE